MTISTIPISESAVADMLVTVVKHWYAKNQGTHHVDMCDEATDTSR
jgi:hypothetical protein